jgi:hypothetical protein
MAWKGIEASNSMPAMELPWERTATESESNCALVDADAQLPPMRVAETDFIELHESADGQHVLLRRGLYLTDENLEYVGSQKPPELDWPIFDNAF